MAQAFIFAPPTCIHGVDKDNNDTFEVGNTKLVIGGGMHMVGGEFLATNKLKKDPQGYVKVYLPGEKEPVEFRLSGEYTKTFDDGTELTIVALQDKDGNIRFGTLTKTEKESLGKKITVWQFNELKGPTGGEPTEEPTGEITVAGKAYPYWIRIISK